MKCYCLQFIQTDEKVQGTLKQSLEVLKASRFNHHCLFKKVVLVTSKPKYEVRMNSFGKTFFLLLFVTLPRQRALLRPYCKQTLHYCKHSHLVANKVTNALFGRQYKHFHCIYSLFWHLSRFNGGSAILLDI